MRRPRQAPVFDRRPTTLSTIPGTLRTPPPHPKMRRAPKGHTTLALPSNHSGGFATIDPRHAGDTPQRSAYGSNSPTEPTPAQHAWERRHVVTTQAPATPKSAPSQYQSTPKPAQKPHTKSAQATRSNPNTHNTHEGAPRLRPWRPYPTRSRRHVLLDARTDDDVGGLVLHDGGNLVDGGAQVVSTQFGGCFLDLDGGAAALEGDE